MIAARVFLLALLSALVLTAPSGSATAANQPAIAAAKGAWPVIAGLLHQLEESARRLGDDQRGPAMRALNAAHRLADVGASVAKGLSLSAANDASETIRQARRSIQNGAPDEAVRHLRDAVPRLRRLIEIGLLDPDSATALAERAEQPRADLRLLDPRGEVLGEIDRVLDTGNPPAVVIETGPWVNVLGFLDLGAQEKEVPAKDILFGKRAAVWLAADPT
jgi:hypothetical protein